MGRSGHRAGVVAAGATTRSAKAHAPSMESRVTGRRRVLLRTPGARSRPPSTPARFKGRIRCGGCMGDGCGLKPRRGLLGRAVRRCARLRVPWSADGLASGGELRGAGRFTQLSEGSANGDVLSRKAGIRSWLPFGRGLRDVRGRRSCRRARNAVHGNSSPQTLQLVTRRLIE